MGDWNETCLISRLPIFRGDRVYMILISTEKYIRCPIVTLPLIGEYNEYGSIDEFEESPNQQCVFDIIKQIGIPTKRMKSLSNITKIPDTTIEDFYDVLTDLLPCDLNLRNKDDDIESTETDDDGVYEDQNYGIEPRFILADIWNGLFSNCKKYIRDVQYYRKDWKPIDFRSNNEYHLFETQNIQFAKDKYKYRNAIELLHDMNKTSKRVYHDYIIANTELDKLLAQTLAILASFHSLRWTWEVSESGSQASDLLLHEKLHKSALKHVQKQIKEARDNDCTYML